MMPFFPVCFLVFVSTATAWPRFLLGRQEAAAGLATVLSCLHSFQTGSAHGTCQGSELLHPAQERCLMAKTWTYPACPSVDEGMTQMWYTHAHVHARTHARTPFMSVSGRVDEAEVVHAHTHT